MRLLTPRHAHTAFCAKELTLGRQFIRSNVGVYLLLFQVVDLAETGSELAKSTAFAFAAPATPGTTFLGKELLTQAVDGRPPLFANVLRVDVTRWRNGTNCVDLPAVSSAVKGGECVRMAGWMDGWMGWLDDRS